jgi:hypothetical protein
MDGWHVWKLRFAIVLVITAFFITGIGVPTPGNETFASQAWAGGRDDDNDGGKKDKKKDFDHFACYSAAEHTVDKDVKIVNQFTKDEYGDRIEVPVTVGALMLLCVPTKKIHIDR